MFKNLISLAVRALFGPPAPEAPKYMPHQGKREMARRQRQAQRGAA